MIMLFRNRITSSVAMLDNLRLAIQSSPATSWAEIATQLSVASRKLSMLCGTRKMKLKPWMN